GLVRPGAQFVHCCAIEHDDVHLLANHRVTVAHCPRSNVRLKCPVAPVREMLDAGILVGLGLDSPASSGPIGMFAEMRSALSVSMERGKPVTPEEVWRMATSMGADSLRAAVPELPKWRIEPGSQVPLIAIHLSTAQTVDDLIQRGTPDKVKWVV